MQLSIDGKTIAWIVIVVCSLIVAWGCRPLWLTLWEGFTKHYMSIIALLAANTLAFAIQYLVVGTLSKDAIIGTTIACCFVDVVLLIGIGIFDE